MKVLIWIGCFLVASILNTLLGYATGIKAGYLVFYFAVYFVAKKLCNMWDERKLDKNRPKRNQENTACKEGKCEMCGHVSDKLTYSKIVDDMGTRYRNLCDVCMSIHNAIPEQKDTNEAPQPLVMEETAVSNEKIQFCRKCGNRLLDGAIFCNKCGTKIIINIGEEK